MVSNEKAWLSENQIRHNLLNIWHVMQACVERGMHKEGVMPGGMNVKRRCANLYRQITGEIPPQTPGVLVGTLDWLNLFALTVSEENASGGRVVTAAAIAILYKENTSLSGAEVGCQGEVGIACSMAAGALAEVLGGTPEQVENTAEIGMEYNLGLTSDPVGGLVQVPCIERNAMGSVKAINAARIALRRDGKHFVSLGKVIKTMRETGADMKSKYKETSRGGLAVNVIEC